VRIRLAQGRLRSFCTTAPLGSIANLRTPGSPVPGKHHTPGKVLGSCVETGAVVDQLLASFERGTLLTAIAVAGGVEVFDGRQVVAGHIAGKIADTVTTLTRRHTEAAATPTPVFKLGLTWPKVRRAHIARQLELLRVFVIDPHAPDLAAVDINNGDADLEVPIAASLPILARPD
jgi:hypothetical protein